jgi:hypothetical protein
MFSVKRECRRAIAFCAPVIALCCFGLILASCSVFDHVDDSGALEALGLNKPIVISASLDRVFDGQGNFLSENLLGASGSTVALVVKSGFLDVVAAPESEPYWRFEPKKGEVKKGGFFGTGLVYEVPIARREVTGRSNEKTWSEESIKFFAETVTYNIVLDDGIAAVLGQKEFGPFSFRLVMVNDPAVGAWQVSLIRGTSFNESDALQQVNEALKRAGTAAEPDLLAKIAAIRDKRSSDINAQYQKIADGLAADGTAARDAADPNVLVSKKNGLAFYVGDIGPAPNSIMDARGYCAKINTSSYQGWRIPHPNELGSMVQNGKLADAPDGRVWGPNLKVPANYQSLLIITDAMIIDRSREPRGMQFMTIYNADFPQGEYGEFVHASIQAWQLKIDQSMSLVQFDVGNNMPGVVVREQALTAIWGNPSFRLVCVTNLVR